MYMFFDRVERALLLYFFFLKFTITVNLIPLGSLKLLILLKNGSSLSKNFSIIFKKKIFITLLSEIFVTTKSQKKNKDKIISDKLLI